MPAELERIGFSMEAFLIPLVALSTLSWVGFALWPWGLWRNRERAHTPFLPSITDVGTLPDFDCRAFSRHDLDVRIPLLVWRTHLLERKGLPASGCHDRIF